LENNRGAVKIVTPFHSLILEMLLLFQISYNFYGDSRICHLTKQKDHRETEDRV